MILETQKNSVVLSQGEETTESIAMSLDMDSANFLMQMLSKNIYSDPIGSLIRETCSNALDSHRCAGTDKPIIVSFRSNDSNYEFSVEDFGCSFTHEEVFNLLSKYGKSTKREDANSLGMWGLGFKSPLAYSSSFYFITRKDGIERKYMMYEGEDSNTIDLLYESPTDEMNGVKVIVPVKYSDRQEFVTKIKEQLAYFEGVYFDVPNINYNNSGIENTFIIHRVEHFQYSELITTSELHICLDNVYYPIDFEKLGISTIKVPLGLRFSLTDEIFPTINREAIRLTVEAKEIILAKIKTVATILVEKYNETIHETKDIDTIFQYYYNNSRYVAIAGKLFEISSISKLSDVKMSVPSLGGVTLLDLADINNGRDRLVCEYSQKYNISYSKISEPKKTRYTDTIYWRDVKKVKYIFDEPMSHLKKEYIKSLCSDGMIVRKQWNYSLGFPPNVYNGYDMRNKYYFTILNLVSKPKSEWRQRIKEFQYIQKMVIDKWIDVDEIEIPQEWIDSRKKQRAISVTSNKRVKLEGDLFGKTACALEKYVSGKNCKFVADTYKLQDVHTQNCLMIYDSYDNQSELDNLYYISSGRSKTRIKCLSFSNRELKQLEKIEIHNLIPFNKFMEGNNKPFKRLITAFLINKLMKEYENVFDKSSILSTISLSLVEKLDRLSQYKRDFLLFADNDIYKTMLEVAESHQLFDMTIYPEYLEMKALLEKLTFLEPILKVTDSYHNSNREQMIPVLISLFKYYRHRIDYKNYHLTLNNTLDLEELLLTEETINELINI